MIVLDDVGFGQLGCFGAPIATPHIDRLADAGLRYNNFSVTAVCSATRACLLTGRNHHKVGMGALPNTPMNYPGYIGRLPRSAGTVARVLRDAGYNTMAVGKWHLTRQHEETAAGPFDRWPLGMGFERFYGILDGMTNQWTPELVHDNTVIEQPTTPQEGYHLTEDLATQAIRMVQDQQQAAPDKPFFLYFATAAGHSPHHVPASWVEPYRGTFDDGWEATRRETFARQLNLGVVPAGTTLVERPPWVQPWEEISQDERRLYARMMEVFAGFLTHTDAQIGRIIDFLTTLDVLDNTIVMLLSDNGAGGDGGPRGMIDFADRDSDIAERIAKIDDLGGFKTFNNYPWAWAWAGNSPFKLFKKYTWLGGVRVPLIVRWPGGIPRAEHGHIRGQFGHAVDLMPTILDAVGISAPEILDGVTQDSIDGASLLPTLSSSTAASPRTTQYYEMKGSRALYHDGWKVTTNHVSNEAIERALI
ncbi:MAG: arylsulfatase, partial [Acidimicrobiia bacterium]